MSGDDEKNAKSGGKFSSNLCLFNDNFRRINRFNGTREFPSILFLFADTTEHARFVFKDNKSTRLYSTLLDSSLPRTRDERMISKRSSRAWSMPRVDAGPFLTGQRFLRCIQVGREKCLCVAGHPTPSFENCNRRETERCTMHGLPRG